MKISKINSLSIPEILALISAVSVLRKEKFLTDLLIYTKSKKIKRNKIYETLLQTYLFAGFPNALISLNILQDIIPAKNTTKKTINNSQILSKGEKTCRKIYGSKFDKLISNINSFSPELSEWLITEGYGKVISRKVLSLKERELSIISILSCQKYESQLYSHINGAIRNKVTTGEIRSVIKNLELLGNKSYTKFGLKVFDKLLTNKNNISKFIFFN